MCSEAMCIKVRQFTGNGVESTVGACIFAVSNDMRTSYEPAYTAHSAVRYEGTDYSL